MLGPGLLALLNLGLGVPATASSWLKVWAVRLLDLGSLGAKVAGDVCCTWVGLGSTDELSAGGTSVT